MEIYDDYAHNPEALEVLLEGVKEKFSQKKNIFVFQPHLFSSTEDFFDDFVKTLSDFDLVYLLPIYQARENPANFKISSELLYQKIKEKNKNTFFCNDFDDCSKKIEKEKYNDQFVLLTVGAGEANIVAKKLLK
jgi:UDP-N-acetylmuramate--alanine ligase